MNQGNIFFQQSGWREKIQGGGGGMPLWYVCKWCNVHAEEERLSVRLRHSDYLAFSELFAYFDYRGS